MVYVDFDVKIFHLSTLRKRRKRWVPIANNGQRYTNLYSLDILHHITMSTYTVAEIRKMVDDLDDRIRAAVVSGNIEAVFCQERATLVSYKFKNIRKILKQEAG